jgi:hypothetical protein
VHDDGEPAGESDFRFAKRIMLLVAVSYRRLAEHAAAQRRREHGKLGGRGTAGEMYSP